MPLFRSKFNATLGIDIGPTSVKLLELSKLEKHYQVENYGNYELSQYAMDGGVISDIDHVAKSIKNMLKNMRLRVKKAIISIPDSCTIRKIIQVSDQLAVCDIEELVLIEIDKHIPYPIHEINFDFKLLGPSIIQLGLHDLLIVASRSEYINHRVDVLRRAGLKASIIDVDSHAIARVLQYIAPTTIGFEIAKTIAWINGEGTHITFYVFHDMKIIFSHYDVMEKYQRLTQNQQFETVLAQVKRLFQFFNFTYPMKVIELIVLAGDLGQHAQLASFLSVQLNRNVEIVNPFHSMRFAKNIDRHSVIENASLLTTVCGLALRG
ncbi:MAG: type IV pilus assembly protein PilM [Legionellaceae bacterium]|nr:type IV pilus assembly protein PilM [Legionellaceae bacterium]